MFEDNLLLHKLWERLNLRAGLTFDEYVEIRKMVKDEQTLRIIDNMVLGNKQYNELDIYVRLNQIYHKLKDNEVTEVEA